MKSEVLTYVVLFVCSVGYSQVQRFDSVKIPSSEQLNNIVFKYKFQLETDSIKLSKWSNAQESRIKAQFGLDSSRLEKKIDSLRNLDLSIPAYTVHLDSLRQQKTRLVSEVDSKKEKLLADSRRNLNKWKTTALEKFGVNKLKTIVPETGLNESINGVAGKMPDVSDNLSALTAGRELPDLKLDDFDPNIADVRPLDELDLPQIPELSNLDLKDIEISDQLGPFNVKVPFDGLDKIDGLSDKIGGATEQFGALKNIGENPDEAIETTLKNVDQFASVTNQLQGAEAVKNNEFIKTAEALKDPSAMQEEAKQILVQQAVNHFQGKEQVLQQAMDKLGKYKNMYQSLPTSAELKSLPRNSMKGKPFRERFVPGVSFQVLAGSYIFLDVNPYAGYKITGRLTSGLCWNQRIGYSLHHNYFTSVSVIYGPRTFAEFKTWKGFIARTEFEWMNTEVPPRLRGFHSGENYREWVRTAFVGLKREYRFLKNVKGTAMVMFSIYNDKRKSPYGDVINSRFGFEFPLAKKKVNRQSN